MKTLAAAMIIALAALFYSLNIKEGQIGHLNDDAYYINAARWFAGVQSEQKDLSSRSLGFPLLMAPLAKVAGESLLPFRLFSLFFMLASLWLVYLIFGKIATPTICFSILLLTAFNHLNLIFSTMVMSEAAYLFFSLLSVWIFIRGIDRDFSYIGAFLQALALAAASCIRPEGFLLATAIYSVLLFQRRFRNCLYGFFFFIILVLPLVTNIFGIGASLDKYVNELLFPMVYAGPLTVIKTGAAYFLKEMATVSFFTQAMRSRMGVWELPAALLAAALVAGGMAPWRGLRKATSSGESDSLLALYIVLYTLFHMLWPAQGARFVIPLLPFIYHFFFLSVSRIAALARLSSKACLKITAFLTALLMGILSYQNYLILITPPPGLFPETFAYVRESSKEGDIFVSETAERFFLKSGIKTILPPPYHSADDFFYALIRRGVTRAAFYRNLLLSTEFSEFPTISAGGIKRYSFFMKNGLRFQKVYENREEGTVIYSLNQAYAADFKKAYEVMIEALGAVKVGNKAFAEKKLKEALVICPTLAKASDNLLALLIDSGRFDDALALKNELEREGRLSSLGLFLAGELYEKSGRKGKAVYYYGLSADEARKTGSPAMLAAVEDALKRSGGLDKAD